MQGAKLTQQANVAGSNTSFDPLRLTLRVGVPARLTFPRTSQKTCARSVALTFLKVTKELPLNERVTVEFAPSQAGELAFAYG